MMTEAEKYCYDCIHNEVCQWQPREYCDFKEKYDGWISVEDEMPKLRQRVMAFCRAGILTFLRYDDEVWFEMSSKNEYLLSFVTHWRPLPEAPKGE